MGYFDQLKEGEDKSAAAPAFRRGGARPRRVIRDIIPPPSPHPTGKTPPPPARKQIKDAATERPKAISVAGKTPEEIRREALPVGTATEPAVSPPAEAHLPILPKKDEKPPADFIVERDLPVHTWEPEKVARRRFRIKLIAWLSVLAVLLVAILPLVLFPKLTVIILPKVQSAALGRIELTGDTAISSPDVGKKQIPAIGLSVEKTLRQDHESTGQKYVEDRAAGKVSLFNALSSSPQTLVSNTRFHDPAGKIYRLRDGVVIPGAKVEEGKIVPTAITVTLFADAPGEEYNGGATELRISNFRGTAKYDGFYARAESGFSGGFKGEAKIVTAEDLKKASEGLSKRIFDELKAEFQKKIPSGPDFAVPDGARQIEITKVEQPLAGDKLQRFTTVITARGRLMAVRRSHLNAVISSVMLTVPSDLAAKFPENQVKMSLDDARPGPTSSQFVFAVKGELVYWREAKVEDLTAIVKTSTPQKAEAYLAGREEIDSIEVKKFPSWLWFIPSRPGGLELVIQPPAI